MLEDNIIVELKEVTKRLDIYNEELREHMMQTLLVRQDVRNHREYFQKQIDLMVDRMEKQEAAFSSLPIKVLHIVSIVGGLLALFKMLR